MSPYIIATATPTFWDWAFVIAWGIALNGFAIYHAIHADKGL